MSSRGVDVFITVHLDCNLAYELFYPFSSLQPQAKQLLPYCIFSKSENLKKYMIYQNVGLFL